MLQRVSLSRQTAEMERCQAVLLAPKDFRRAIVYMMSAMSAHVREINLARIPVPTRRCWNACRVKKKRTPFVTAQKELRRIARAVLVISKVKIMVIQVQNDSSTKQTTSGFLKLSWIFGWRLLCNNFETEKVHKNVMLKFKWSK